MNQSLTVNSEMARVLLVSHFIEQFGRVPTTEELTMYILYLTNDLLPWMNRTAKDFTTTAKNNRLTPVGLKT